MLAIAEVRAPLALTTSAPTSSLGNSPNFFFFAVAQSLEIGSRWGSKDPSGLELEYYTQKKGVSSDKATGRGKPERCAGPTTRASYAGGAPPDN